jgi:hypothetical protein
MSTEAAAPARRSWAWIWQVLGLVLAFYIVEQNIEDQLLNMGLTIQAGTLAVDEAVAPQYGPHVQVVKGFAPGSPLPAAGVAVGDLVRYDRPIDHVRVLTRGEPVGLTVVHGKRTSHVVVAAVARPPLDPTSQAYETAFNISDLISVLVGVFILLRSRGSAAALALGGALIGFGLTELNPQWLESGPAFAGGFAALNFGLTIVEPVLFLIFAALFFRDNGGRIGAATGWGIAIYALAGLACAEVWAHCAMTAVVLPVLGGGSGPLFLLVTVGLIATLGFLVAGWRRSSRDARRRYTLLLIAISAVISAQVAQMALADFVANYRNTPWILFYDGLSGVVAPVLFAYAILRHKVLDLGFAINRTLVYGVVSVVLLVGFGLVEWASEKFIPIESREKNLFIDAAIALGIFLVFHRVRDFAEEVIEEIFFRDWRHKEKALRQFAGDAAYILSRPALTGGLVKAVKAFCGGAEVALYLPGEGPGYRLAEGGFAAIGERLDGDEEMLVRLRATRQPVETGEGTLALPMVHRNEVSGVVVIGHKPSGEAWRPDEREVLAWAVMQAGHDLHALKIEQLESEAAGLRQENAILAAQVAMVRGR